MTPFLQASFKGGIRQDIDATKVAQLGDSYFLGVNIRTPKDVLEPVRSPLDLTDTVPEGKLQGVYGANSFILLFVDGFPFIKDYSDPLTGYVKLGTKQIDPSVDYIYAEFVPGSTIGYGRVATPILNPDNSVIRSDNISFDREIPFNSSIQGVIYQDGINQARLITDDGSVRDLKDYAAWTVENREYVPKGKQMLWTAGGILYMVSADNKELFHSVSGRPLDFVVAVDQDGNKSGAEVEGGAPAVSHRVDYEPITMVRPVPAEDTFVITTKTKTFLNQELLDEENLIFGEPSFSALQIAAVGAVNHLCAGDLNGDTGIINPNGIHSFNASAILKTESGNDPVTGVVSSLFKLDEHTRVTQDFPCAKEFGADYTLFAVNTIYGRGVLVYDRTISRFVSLDIYEGVAQIKQFAEIIVNGVRRLFFITVDNKFYEAFAGETVETSGIIVGEWCSNNPREENTPMFLHCVFSECQEDGNVTVTPIVNRIHYTSKREELHAMMPQATLPIVPPFGGGTEDTTQIVTFNLHGTVKPGWKIGTWIQWDVDAKLTHIMLNAEPSIQDTGNKAKARRFAATN